MQEKKSHSMDIRIEEKVFETRRFLGEDFRGTSFISVRFKQCLLSDCLLEGARFQEVVFEECKLAGMGFHVCQQKPFFTMSAKNSIFLGCNFAGCALPHFSASGCRFEGCHFSETKLTESDFSACHFIESPMHHCDIRKTDFRGAEGYSIDPRVNTIQKAKFSLPEAVRLLHYFDIEIQ